MRTQLIQAWNRLEEKERRWVKEKEDERDAAWFCGFTNVQAPSLELALAFHHPHFSLAHPGRAESSH